MARPKPKEEKQAVTVRLTPYPAYALVADHPDLMGHAFIGLSPEKAMANARAELAHRFPHHKYDLMVIGGYEE